MRDVPTLELPETVRTHKACAAWVKYHTANRKVFSAIMHEIDKAVAAGRTKASVKAIINYLRWNMYITSGEEYKINDRYTGIYTHVILHNYPHLASIIDTRELRAINPETV
jgi:hypothetical protein